MPDTSIFRLTGSFQPCSGRTLTRPPRTATSSASTSMPGLVTRTSRPPRTSAWICSVGLVITASGEVELHGPADSAYLHPLRDYPPAAPRGIPALVVEPDDVFSLGCDPARLGQVSRQRRQFSARAGRQGRAQTLVKLGRSRPPVASRNTEPLDRPVPVIIGGPQLRLTASTGTSGRRKTIARHGHILQDITWTRNRRTGPIPRPDEGPARDRRRLPAAGAPRGPGTVRAIFGPVAWR